MRIFSVLIYLYNSHVIICGHITHHSLTSFLRDFLHKGREQVDELDVLIIDRKTPDIEMEGLLKRYSTKLQYFVGSIMNIADLKRVQVCSFIYNQLIISKSLLIGFMFKGEE